MRQKPKYQPLKKLRLYLDENFPQECIAGFSKFDPKHAVLDYGLLHREDIFHYAYARKERRVLLTLDRDFEDDIEFKLNQTFGVIIISVSSPAVPERINGVSKRLVKLLSTKSLGSLKSCKIFATINGWTIWYLENGQKIKENYPW